jgi:hypothetical protein
MISVSLKWLKAEATAQGLSLTDEDLEAIGRQVEKNKTALAGVRPQETHGLEPPYIFAPGNSRQS